MNGHERRQARRLASFLARGCAVLATWAFATSVLAATVELSTSDGAPGGTVKLTMSLTGDVSDPPFAGVQVDLIIERAQLGIDAQCSTAATQCDSGLDCPDGEACSLLSCDKDPRLPAAVQLVADSPRFQNVPVAATAKRLRLGVTGPVIPVTTWDDGVVLTCDLDVPGSAALGLQNLSSDRLVVSDGEANVIPAQVVILPGRIVDPTELTPPPTGTPTPSPTGGGGTPTSTSTSTNGVSTPTRTATTASTSTPGGGSPTPVPPTATNTPTGPQPTDTPTNRGGGGGGGCDCAISPEADTNKGTALMWLSLLPIGLLWRRRSRDF